MIAIISKSFPKVLLLAIIIVAASLRFYRLDINPPSLSWDEAAVGYNAYTIVNWGRDEWGKFLPSSFKSFEDDKHPVHIYLTAVSVRLFGLSEFATRFPSALFGVLNVLMIFLLGTTIFKNCKAGLIAAFFLAISPYNIQFSRFNHEANFVLFFFMLGLLLFFKGVEGKERLLPWGFLSFGISLLSYHISKVIIPPVLLILILFFRKDLIKIKKHFIAGILILTLVVLLMISDKTLLGGARFKQTSISFGKITKTDVYKKTGNELLGRAEVILRQYLLHFDSKYLFETGSTNSKFSIQTVGHFYKTDALFLTIGFIGIIGAIFFKPIFRKGFSILILWAVLSPIPSSLTEEAPHAARAGFQMGSWILISAYGFYLITIFFRKKFIRYGILSALLFPTFILSKTYLTELFTNYPVKHGIDWQYGMKQIVEHVKENEYSSVYVTDIRFQPYIFFLYYLKIPLPEYLNTVIYTRDIENRKYNLVSSFDKYFFGGWDPVESMPYQGVLYVLSPSQYDGLKHRSEFDVKKVIRYPDGGDAFFLVSAK